jgi:branched-chain amino acid aminotransferase
MSLLWINGQLVDKAAARVSPFDHGFLYGDGVWEHLRVFGGTLFRPADAMRLLYTAAFNLGIDIPLSRDELTAAMEATVRANNRTEGYVRVIVSRGPGTIGPDPRKIDPQVYIIAEEYQPFPTELYGHGLHVVISEPGGYSIGRPPIFRRLGQYHLIKAKQDALAGGCLEAVLVDDCYHVYGCTEGHLFRVLGGVIRQVTNFPGDITAHYCVNDLAASVGVPFTRKIEEIDRVPTPDNLLSAEEVFLAGTSCGVIGIVRINGEGIGGGTEGPVTRQVREAYRRLTRGPE